jgi:hypothetical protein
MTEQFLNGIRRDPFIEQQATVGSAQVVKYCGWLDFRGLTPCPHLPAHVHAVDVLENRLLFLLILHERRKEF